MFLGNARIWFEKFRDLDVRFLERVSEMWPLCRALLPQNPHENTITINLVNVLAKDAEIRRMCHHLAYQHEVFGFTNDGLAYSKGKIDLALLLDAELDHYLAYECKKVHVKDKARFRSLATEYVKEGVMRFVNERYAASLPIGCLLAYVMDNELEKAQNRIEAAMLSRKKLLRLKDSIVNAPPIGSIRRFFSRHNRDHDGGEIELRHAMLGYS